MKTLSLLIVFFISACKLFSGAIVVGYTNAISVSSNWPSVKNQAARFNWFFAHASVGDDIMNGIESLYTSNPTLYPLTHNSATGMPPATTQAGVIYDYMRGNPGWQAKVDGFSNYVCNGWSNGAVNVVMNKFCFIDPYTDINYYLNSMTNLELTHLQTFFIYATIPLTTNEDSDNYTRNIFNDTLRAWVQTNNRILYDVADIEAHDPNGVLQTFVYNGRNCQKLFSVYSDDGGHPDSSTAEQAAALGFYAVSAALLTADRDGDGVPDWWEMAHGLNPLDPTDANADPDGDGMSNLKEFLSGTDPHDPASVLKIGTVSCSGGLFQMQFTADSNITYSVQYSKSYPELATNSWQSLGNIAANPSERSILVVDHLNGDGSPCFYRILANRVSFGPP